MIKKIRQVILSYFSDLYKLPAPRIRRCLNCSMFENSYSRVLTSIRVFVCFFVSGCLLLVAGGCLILFDNLSARDQIPTKPSLQEKDKFINQTFENKVGKQFKRPVNMKVF